MTYEPVLPLQQIENESRPAFRHEAVIRPEPLAPAAAFLTLFAAFSNDGFREWLAFDLNRLELVKLVVRFIACGNVTDYTLG